jgi:hypothetical protein
MKMKYISNDVLTSTSGSPEYISFTMNGLFDPDISGTGQQPQYFDEMKALYTT